jgi:hypothetical protein
MSKKLLVFAVLAVAALAAGAWFAQMRYAPQSVAPQAVSTLWQLQFADLRGQRNPCRNGGERCWC